MQRKNRPVFLLSLRVLARFAEGVPASRRELQMLRANASRAVAALPIEELCWWLIQQELGARKAASAGVLPRPAARRRTAGRVVPIDARCRRGGARD